jgi:outer membrane protein OmpA-like peptidoglycan-associated protein
MSLISDLFSSLDKRNLTGIADGLGESDLSVSRGMQGAIAAVMGGLATKSNNPSFLRRILDLAASGTSDVSWSRMTSSLADPNSSLISGGKQILSSLFGNSEGLLTRALGSGLGLKSGTTSSLLAMAAPMVMSFLGKRVHDERLSMEGLGNLLERETPAIRAALPAGVTDLIWPREHETVAASPVVAQTVARESSSGAWVLPLLLLALIPGIFWLFNHWRRPVVRPATVSTGTANRMTPDFVQTPIVNLPGSINLHFATGSSRLDRDSAKQLNEFIAALSSDRNANVNVSGYTDNTGDEAANMRLSQQRADAVKADLIQRGIANGRLTAQAFGEENPVADNATASGRGMNRRVTVSIAPR